MNSDHQHGAMEQILLDGTSRSQQQRFERKISEYAGYIALFLSVGLIFGGLIFLL